MSRQALKGYLTGLLGIYQNSRRSEKTQLLDQAEKITGKSRRTIQRYMAQTPQQLEQSHVKIQGRGRGRIYPVEQFLPDIRRLWRSMEMISAERMVEALPKWLPYYDEPTCTGEIRNKLQEMSRNTIERFLVPLRQENNARKGLSTTSSALRAFKSKIPINTLDRQAVRPGFTQSDTVAHCGNTTAGQYVNSITLTDLWSGWTANRSIPTKKAIHVRHAFENIKRKLPFDLIAVNTDSGSEFINAEVLEFMNPNKPYGQKTIIFTRSRPYKKNDNCYVEQRNYTHVRQLFGYYRIEDGSLVELMNEIYTEYWNPLHNFFLPSQKLVSKTRVGAKIVKKHDTPITPADRLLASEHLSEEQKQQLREQATQLNPFQLSQRMEQKLKFFFDLYKQSVAHKEAA